MQAVGADQTGAASRLFLIRSIDVRIDAHVTKAVSAHDRDIAARRITSVGDIDDGISQVQVRGVVDLVRAVYCR